MPLLTTAKAYVSALATGVVAALGASEQFVDGPWAALIFVLLSVLASYGFVYRVPNASPTSIARRRRGPVGDAVGDLLDPAGGEPPA